jgi:hypothetical protein
MIFCYILYWQNFAREIATRKGKKNEEQIFYLSRKRKLEMEMRKEIKTLLVSVYLVKFVSFLVELLLN